MKIQLLIVVVILIVHFSCKMNIDPISSNNDQLEILPLKLNNTWYNQHTSYDSLGQPRKVQIDTSTICCDTLVNGITYYKFSGLGYTWQYNDEIGLWHIPYCGRSGFGNPYLFRKYPCKVGDTFNDFIVASTDTLINSIIGNVKCILFIANLGNYYIEDFSKPGIGQIRGTLYQLNSENQYVKSEEFELIGYKF